MQYSALENALYHTLQAYDHLAVANWYEGSQTLAAAKSATLTAYLVLREFPRALERLEAGEQEEHDPS